MVSPSTAHLYTEIAASVLRYNFLTWHVLFLFPYWEISAHLFPCLCCLCHYSRSLPESHFCAPTASPVPSMACCVCHSCQMMWCSEANQIAFSSHMVFWFAFSHVRLLLCCSFILVVFIYVCSKYFVLWAESATNKMISFPWQFSLAQYSISTL